MTALPRLYTETEAAEALRVCARTLRKWRQDGKLPFVKFGSKIWRLSPCDKYPQGRAPRLLKWGRR